jgi:hypothetical protein
MNSGLCSPVTSITSGVVPEDILFLSANFRKMCGLMPVRRYLTIVAAGKHFSDAASPQWW